MNSLAENFPHPGSVAVRFVASMEPTLKVGRRRPSSDTYITHKTFIQCAQKEKTDRRCIYGFHRE